LQLTFTAWVQSLNTRDDGRRKTNASCQQHEPLSRHAIGLFSFITSLKSIFLQSSNHTEHSHAQNTTALQPNIYLTVILRLLVKNKGRAPFPSAHYCHIQLQTSESVSVGYKPPKIIFEQNRQLINIKVKTLAKERKDERNEVCTTVAAMSRPQTLSLNTNLKHIFQSTLRMSFLLNNPSQRLQILDRDKSVDESG
jgi:hypothetical protein